MMARRAPIAKGTSPTFAEFVHNTDAEEERSKMIAQEAIGEPATPIDTRFSLIMQARYVARRNAKYAMDNAGSFENPRFVLAACAKAERLAREAYGNTGAVFKILHPFAAKRLRRTYEIHATAIEEVGIEAFTRASSEAIRKAADSLRLFKKG